MQQEHLHAADHGHDGLAPVSSNAAAVHLQGARIHPRVLRDLLTVAGGAAAHLGGDVRGEGRHSGGHPRDAGGQQGGRGDDARGDAGRGRGAGAALELQLHGDVGQDQPQRQGAVPGAAQHGEESLHLAAAGRQEPQRQGHQQDQGEVQRDVIGPQRTSTLNSHTSRVHD